MAEEYDTTIPWRMHIEWMDKHYGRRNPPCFWCDQPVWMSLQGYFSGGTWTTDPEAEGPNKIISDRASEVCAASPDGTHDVLSLNAYVLPSEAREEADDAD